MPAAKPSAHTHPAQIILAVIAAGAAIYALADILTPPAMALFLAIVIDGFARVLERRVTWISKASAMPIAIVLSIVLFGAAVFVIGDNASSFAAKLVTYLPKLNALIARGAGLAHLDVAPTVDELITRLNPSKYLGDVAKGFQTFASNAIFILIYLGFILASRRSFDRKLVNLSGNRAQRHEAMEAFSRIRDGVEQYLWVQTVTGLMIAVASWAVMALLGLENAVFWAFLIFIASYIPIIGGAIGILAPPLFALVQYDTVWQAIVLISVLQTIQFVVGNVILPRMQGDSLNIDPVVVLLSLAFWGAVWGVPGMFLSTPLTVIAMVVCAQFDGARWVAVLLSANGSPDKLKDRKTPVSPDEGPAPKLDHDVTQA
ncbi:AI-2E family transporter [Phenylobacterium aquaticum]|uniref:AI-2E family transporter n=1 Tax=Phenylobacterium aquaticum TaxID=1763816 RepID=UPI0026EAEF83|nr:AI-2E family transporter [Phenylobacterium aquaticum]